MRTWIRSTLRSVFAAVSVLGFAVAVLLGFSGSGSPAIPLASALVGAVALAIAAGPEAILRVLGVDRTSDDSEDDREWWLARLEPVLEDVWDQQADYALAVGLAVIGVGALVGLVAYPGEEPPMGLAVVGLLGLNGALIALAGSAMES